MTTFSPPILIIFEILTFNSRPEPEPEYEETIVVSKSEQELDIDGGVNYVFSRSLGSRDNKSITIRTIVIDELEKILVDSF